jgi:hypothetical protein
MTTTAAVPKARTPRRTRVAEIAGILGAIVCILALVAVWLGAAAVSGKVDDLSNAVNAGVQKAVDVTNTVAGRLDGLASQVGDVAQNANEVAANPTPPDALAGLSERYAQFIATYQNIRVQYSDAKANLTSAVASLQRVASFIPGIDPPDPPGILPAIDAKLQSIDDTVSGALPQPGQPTAAVATKIATAATTVQGFISDLASSVRGLQGSIGDVQNRAHSALDTIRNALLAVTVVLTVLLLWILVLNVSLFNLGRAWKREAQYKAAAAGASAAVATRADVTPAPTAAPAAAPMASAPTSDAAAEVTDSAAATDGAASVADDAAGATEGAETAADDTAAGEAEAADSATAMADTPPAEDAAASGEAPATDDA